MQPTDYYRTPRRYSILQGIIGGGLDLGFCLLLLTTVPIASTGTGMGVGWAYIGSILLFLLGGTVLGSTFQMIGMRSAARRRGQGFLMIIFGALMFVVGAAMLGRVFPLMQGSVPSGGAMIAVGVGMLYVGATMRRVRTSAR